MSKKMRKPKSAILRIGEAAALAGVSVDTLRQWDRDRVLCARRTPGGQRQYLLEEVEGFMRRGARRSTSPPPVNPLPPSGYAATPTTRGNPRSPFQDLPEELTAPWEEEVAQARAEVEILRARADAQALQRAAEQETQAAGRRAEEERTHRQVERHLQELKSFGRNLAASLPTEWKAKVVALLEDFVTARQFPGSLSDAEAYAIVRDRVGARIETLRATEDERRADESAALERSLQQNREQEHVQSLITRGKTHALIRTIGWNREDSERAQREVARELRSQVRSDWTEAEVLDCVVEILDDWVEDDEDGD